VAAFLSMESALLLGPPAALGLAVASVLARRIDSGVALLSQGWLPARVTLEATLLAMLLLLAVSIVPVVRSISAEIAPRLMRE
jgi:hypothetical protein